jgi:hypothetical protein
VSDDVTFTNKTDAWNFRVGERVAIPDPWGGDDKPRGGVMVVERIDRVNGIMTLRGATRWERVTRFLLTPLRWLLRRRLS